MGIGFHLQKHTFGKDFSCQKRKKKQRNDSYHLVLMNCNTPLSEAAVWSLPLWGQGGIDKVPLCKVIMGDERQGSLTLPRLFMLPSIQSIPVYGFLFHPTKITSWGKNVQEYGVKTIKSVENKYL